VRTVGVSLEAETGKYKRDVDDAAKTTRGLKDEVDGLGRSSERTSRQVDGLGGDFRGTARDAKALDREISTVQRSLAGLAVEFAAAGNAADRLNLSKGIRKQQGELRNLLKVQKLLPTPAEVEAPARSLGRKLMDGIGSGVSKAPLSPQMLAAVGAAAVVAAPLLAAAMSGAVIGGAGIGGVVGGIMLAAKDERVQAAVAGLSDRMQARLEKAGAAFVGPTLQGLTTLEHAVNRIGLERMLADSSRFVQPLADGIASAVVNLGDGLESLVANAGPVITAIAGGLRDIGGTVGDALKQMAQNGPEAAAALRDLFSVISGSLDTTFQFVNLLSDLYGFAKKIGADTGLQIVLKATGASMDDAGKSAGRLATHTAGAADGVTSLMTASDPASIAANKLADSYQAVDGAARGQLSSMKALSTELRAQVDPAFALIAAQQSLAAAQDKAAEATRKHGRNSKEAKAATRELAVAALDLQGKAGDLSGTFDGRLSPAMRATFKAAGLTKGQIHDIEQQMKQAKKAGDAYAKRYKADVELTGEYAVGHGLGQLSLMQQALKKGTQVPAPLRRAFGYDTGGWTGPGGKYEPAGIVHADEFVIRKESRHKIERQAPGLLDRMNETGELGYDGRRPRHLAVQGHRVEDPDPLGRRGPRRGHPGHAGRRRPDAELHHQRRPLPVPEHGPHLGLPGQRPHAQRKPVVPRAAPRRGLAAVARVGRVVEPALQEPDQGVHLPLERPEHPQRSPTHLHRRDLPAALRRQRPRPHRHGQRRRHQ
jgi:hypothetical protein